MNRTKIMAKSFIISIIVFLVQGILNIIRTKIFISYYGSDSNGVVQISNQIFSYLVLLESGLGAAYLYKMYSPFESGNYAKIHSLVKGLSISLKKISKKMLIVLIIISFLYPMIIADNTLPYLKISLIILLLGIRFIIPYYLYVYKKNLIYLYERKYIVDLIDGFTNSTILIIEIILASLFKVDILITISIGIILCFISNYIYSLVIEKKYKAILETKVDATFEGNTMTKDILIHQISSTIFSSTDSIILSVLDSLNSVTMYNAYSSIINYPVSLINKITDSIRATFGKKIIKDPDGTYKIFNETIALNIFTSVITTIMFLLLINDFITLWIGSQYKLNNFCVILFSLTLIHRCIMPTVYIARDSKGLYKESKNYTIAQAITNIIISLLLIKPLGIMGLLIGTVVSTYLILIHFNYNLVYSRVFNKKNTLIIKLIFMIIFVLLASFLLELFNAMLLLESNTWSAFIFKAIIDFILASIITFVTEWLLIPEFKTVLKRFKRL